MLDFNEAKDSYRSAIDHAVAFTGADHDFFVMEKGRRLLELVGRRFSHNARLQLLDVGCGHGFVHPALTAAGHDVTGVEIAEQVLAIARHANPEVRYLPYDGNVLPFADGIFDVVMAMCVVHHVPVPQWEKFMCELGRVVRPGGLVVIFEHNPLNPVVRYLFRHRFDGMDKGATMIGPRQLSRLLRGAGCPGAKTDYIFFTPFTGGFFRWLDHALAWLPLGAQYMTWARR
jgi:SAM-dependent methyltransferase